MPGKQTEKGKGMTRSVYIEGYQGGKKLTSLKTKLGAQEGRKG